jgi:hypothetical protein
MRVALCAILIGVSHGVAYTDDASDREYRVKAAFVYNFLKFVQGGRFVPPKEDGREKDKAGRSIVIGVLGVPPSRIAFEGLQGRTVGNRPLRVHWFRGFEEWTDKEEDLPRQHPDLEKIRECHVLFVCPSEGPFLRRILPSLRDDGILTVGDVPTFLESGGMVNLLIVEKKVRFEINLAAARRARLAIRSGLLRLAVRTIEHDRLEPKEGGEEQDEAGQS